jgi:hypothetical protein
MKIVKLTWLIVLAVGITAFMILKSCQYQPSLRVANLGVDHSRVLLTNQSWLPIQVEVASTSFFAGSIFVQAGDGSSIEGLDQKTLDWKQAGLPEFHQVYLWPGESLSWTVKHNEIQLQKNPFPLLPTKGMTIIGAKLTKINFYDIYGSHTVDLIAPTPAKP